MVVAAAMTGKKLRSLKSRGEGQVSRLSNEEVCT